MKNKLWLWFLVGFVTVFVVLAVVLKTFVLLPDGSALARVPLWRYYAIEIPRMLGPQRLGSVMTSPLNVLTNLAQHAGVAALGGLITAGGSWVVGRLRRRVR